jgi:flavin-dependent dehydrogenase
MASGPNSCFDADLIVLGGGPAGTAAAITAAQKKLTVVLIERDEFPRHRVGEALHPGVEVLFRQLGVQAGIESAGFLRYSSTMVGNSDSLSERTFGSDQSGVWKGYQAWRPQLDSILLQGALESGACILQPCRTLRIRNSNARLVGIKTSSGELRAPFIIDASGGCRWLARQLCLLPQSVSPRLTCRYGYFESPEAQPEIPCFQESPTGWTWVARVRPALSQWVALDLRPDATPPAPPEGLRWRSAIRGADVTWRLVAQCAGEGYFLCGDAAAVLDPAGARGVLRGLMTGVMAAHLASEILNGNIPEQGAIGGYRQWLAEWFCRDAIELAHRYQAMANPLEWLSSVRASCEALAAGRLT